MIRAYVGIGANLGDRETTLRSAVDTLDRTPGIRVLRRSRWSETEPVGNPNQPRFLNGVVEIETELPPRDLLGRLLAIETSFGRDRSPTAPRRGPRTLDLDLLTYGDRTISEPGLVVPHPLAHEREFVLAPLEELDPVLAHRMREGGRT